MPKKSIIDIVLPNGETHSITKQKYKELEAISLERMISDGEEISPEQLYLDEVGSREDAISLSSIATPVKTPEKPETPEQVETRRQRRERLFSQKDSIVRDLNATMQDVVKKPSVDRPMNNEEMCERIVSMLPSIGLQGEISSNFEYVTFTVDSQRYGATSTLVPTGGHFHIIQSYGGTETPHTGARLCFMSNNTEYSIEVDHSSNPKLSKITALKERENGCSRPGVYIRGYPGESIATPLQYLSKGLIETLGLDYNRNFQKGVYLFEILQQLYSVIVSANKGTTYFKDAGIITGGRRQRKTRRKDKKIRKTKKHARKKSRKYKKRNNRKTRRN